MQIYKYSELLVGKSKEIQLSLKTSKSISFKANSQLSRPSREQHNLIHTNCESFSHYDSLGGFKFPRILTIGLSFASILVFQFN